MGFRELFRKVKKDFGTKEMHDLFLRMKEVDLTENEQKTIDTWVDDYVVRKLLFIKYKEAIAFEKRVAEAEGYEIYEILDDLKKAFPKDFAEVSNGIPARVLIKVLDAYLYQMSWELSHEIVYGKRRIVIVAYVVRLLLIILAILIIILIFKRMK